MQPNGRRSSARLGLRGDVSRRRPQNAQDTVKRTSVVVLYFTFLIKLQSAVTDVKFQKGVVTARIDMSSTLDYF